MDGAQQVTQGAGADLQVALVGNAKVTKRRPEGVEVLYSPVLPRTRTGLRPEPLFADPGGSDSGTGARQSYSVPLRARLEDGDDANGFYLYAQVDPKNEVEEKTRENNVARTQLK